MQSLAEIMSELDRGHEKLPATPVKRGYLEASLGASSVYGPVAQAEAGYLLLPSLSAVAFGRWTPSETTTGAGLRWTF